MEDLKKQESTVDSTELTDKQLDAVCSGETMLDTIAPIFAAAG